MATPSAATSYAESLLFHKSFYFQQRRGSLDLRSISRVDVERIIREVDIDTLQSFLENITFSDLNSEELSLYSDECFVRLFQLSQLTLEYLLNVQDTLASNLDSLAQKYSRKKRELERTKQSVADKDEEIEKLKRENRRKRKTILAYETMLRQTPPAAEEAAQKQLAATNAAAAKALPTAELHIYIIRWFIGTCMDLTVFGSMTVLELKAKLQQLTCSTMPLHEQHVALKGLQLKDSDRLCDVNVCDESVLVLMDGNTPKPEQPVAFAQPQIMVMPAPAAAPAAAPIQTVPNPSDPSFAAQAARQDELYKVALESQAQLASAAEMLKEEIKKGQEREALMREEMERRVKMMEESIRHEVKQELQLQEKSNPMSAATTPNNTTLTGGGALAPIKMSNAGDLESDDEEEEVLTRTEIAARMGEAELKAKRLEAELRESMDIQRKSLKDKEEMKAAMEEAKRREEQMRIEKENAILQAPKQSEEVGQDNDDEEDGPMVFADDDSDAEEEAKKKVEQEEEEEKQKQKQKEKEEKEKEEAEMKAKQEEEEEGEKAEQEEKETVKLPEEWEIHFKNDKVSVSLDASSDLESVRTSLASKLKDAASSEQVSRAKRAVCATPGLTRPPCSHSGCARTDTRSLVQVSFMKSVEVEVDGKTVTQSIEIKTMQELREAHENEQLQIEVKRDDEKEGDKVEVIDFGTVARKVGAMNSAVEKMAAARGKHLDAESEEEAEEDDLALMVRKELTRVGVVNLPAMMKMFEDADVNNDGVLSLEEFKTILKQLELDFKAEEEGKLLSHLDKNGDGKLDFEEFSSLVGIDKKEQKETNDLAMMVRKELKRVTKDTGKDSPAMAKMFKDADANSDGVLGLTEFKTVLKELGFDFEPEEEDKLLTHLDKNGDGQLSYEEFSNLMTQTDLKTEKKKDKDKEREEDDDEEEDDKAESSGEDDDQVAKKKKAEEEAALKKIGKGGCCKQS